MVISNSALCLARRRTAQDPLGLLRRSTHAARRSLARLASFARPHQPGHSLRHLALGVARCYLRQVRTRQSSEQRPVVRYLEMQQLMDNDPRLKLCRLAEEASTARQASQRRTACRLVFHRPHVDFIRRHPNPLRPRQHLGLGHLSGYDSVHPHHFGTMGQSFMTPRQEPEPRSAAGSLLPLVRARLA